MTVVENEEAPEGAGQGHKLMDGPQEGLRTLVECTCLTCTEPWASASAPWEPGVLAQP